MGIVSILSYNEKKNEFLSPFLEEYRMTLRDITCRMFQQGVPISEANVVVRGYLLCIGKLISRFQTHFGACNLLQ